MRAPPKYLKEHAAESNPRGPAQALADGAWCGHGEPNFVVYDIHDEGERVLGVILPTVDYPELCAVATRRKGHSPFMVYDPRLHPASIYADTSTDYPYHPAAPYQCACRSERFKVSAGFEVPLIARNRRTPVGSHLQCSASGAENGRSFLTMKPLSRWQEKPVNGPMLVLDL